MRRVLQRIDNGYYYHGPGEWTDDPLKAHEFSTGSSAIECFIREHLPPARLIFKFEDSAYHVCLPLGPWASSQPRCRGCLGYRFWGRDSIARPRRSVAAAGRWSVHNRTECDKNG